MLKNENGRSYLSDHFRREMAPGVLLVARKAVFLSKKPWNIKPADNHSISSGKEPNKH